MNKKHRYEQEDPTPEEIAKMTAKIREGWSPREYAKRGEPSKAAPLPIAHTYLREKGHSFSHWIFTGEE